MDKIYLVCIETICEGHFDVIPCISLDVAKMVLKDEKMKVISNYASTYMGIEVKKNDAEHFSIIDKFGDYRTDIYIEVKDIIK